MGEIFYKNINWADSDHSKWLSDNCESLLCEAELSNKSIVLDIGCHEGKWISHIYSRYKCKCIGLEPVTKFYNSCSNSSTISYHNFCLTTKDDHFAQMSINRAESKINSHGENAFFRNAKVFFEKYNSVFDLVQMNNEGYEYELIAYMFENNLFKYVKSIQVHFHNISNLSEIKYNNIKKCFEGNKFNTVFDYRFVWSKFIKEYHENIHSGKTRSFFSKLFERNKVWNVR
jgi:hypothetical protein